jgi:hypothetical protein
MILDKKFEGTLDQVGPSEPACREGHTRSPCSRPAALPPPRRTQARVDAGCLERCAAHTLTQQMLCTMILTASATPLSSAPGRGLPRGLLGAAARRRVPHRPGAARLAGARGGHAVCAQPKGGGVRPGWLAGWWGARVLEGLRGSCTLRGGARERLARCCAAARSKADRHRRGCSEQARRFNGCAAT